MRARFLPLNDIAEFGKTDTVVLTISISPGEAQDILNQVQDSQRIETESRPLRLLMGYLQTIAGNHSTTDAYAQEMVNTDGRVGLAAGPR